MKEKLSFIIFQFLRMETIASFNIFTTGNFKQTKVSLQSNVELLELLLFCW